MRFVFCLSGAADSSAPTFANVLHGQINLRDAIRREIDFETGGKKYKLVENPAVLIVRYVFGILFYSHMLHEYLVVREDGISMNYV